MNEVYAKYMIQVWRKFKLALLVCLVRLPGVLIDYKYSLGKSLEYFFWFIWNSSSVVVAFMENSLVCFALSAHMSVWVESVLAYVPCHLAYTIIVYITLAKLQLGRNMNIPFLSEKITYAGMGIKTYNFF